MFKKEPALAWGTIGGAVTALLAVWASANSTGATNWSLLTLAAIPIAANALVRLGVLPVDKVKAAIAVADTWTDVGKDLARKVDVAITERPTDTP